jgi:uncharacterized membrane protein YphA (DoxX/SURF4 family)
LTRSCPAARIDCGRVAIAQQPQCALGSQASQTSRAGCASVARVSVSGNKFQYSRSSRPGTSSSASRNTPVHAARPLITFDWYRSFLQFLIDTNSAGWFSYVIVFGELAVGIGLILGAFVGLAAAGGLLMNMAFLLAGTTSTNPMLALLGVLLILAWKNAGYIGLDRYLLPLLGTPWRQTHAPVPVKAAPTGPVPQPTT